MSARQRGFTLIEMLIAVSLLALLMAMLFSGLSAGTRHIGRQSERAERAASTMLAQNFLRAQLADARALTPSNTPSDAITFDGRADGLDFVSAPPQSVTTGGLQVLSLGLVDARDAGGEQLLVGWRPFSGSGTGASASAAVGSEHRTALLDHIHEAAFAYYGVVDPSQAPGWHPTWRNMSYLPSLVRLSVTFADGQHMPEFVVALRASPAATGALVNPEPQ